MPNQSPRHALPYLFSGQAQKEVTHNEALAALDALLHPVVEAVLDVPPTLSGEDEGKCWLVGEGGEGAWAGRSGELACWTSGGWRFYTLPTGTRCHLRVLACDLILGAESPAIAPEIANPSGGALIDEEARQIIVLLLEHLRAIGVLRAGD